MTDSAPTVAAHAVRAAAAELLHGDVLYFPVRHHSPACAWHLGRLIRERRPSAVLVEGPASFSKHIDLLLHPQARTPLALYAYCVFKRKDGEEQDAVRRFAAYYPFCDYSPELVALREGRAAGAQLRFIDLEFAEQCALDEGRQQAQSLLDEHHLAHSRYLKLLAQRAGCRDHDELWDHLFESAGTQRETAAFVADVYAYCRLAREATPADALERDGTLARERAMAAHVARALRERKSDAAPILVVTGGFHTVALPGLVRESPESQAVRTPGLSDHRSALIRYSFDRLDRLNGYASGMPAPAWYQATWERLGKRTRENLATLWRESALAMILEIATRVRGTLVHENLPTASVIAAFEQAQRLAAMRDRLGPTRADVIDALTSCFVKGDVDIDGVALLQLVHQALAGRALGTVPPGASVPPLVTDFQWRARRQRLKIDETGARRASLDLYRRPEHRATSRLMHGLAALGVPFAVHQGGPDFVRGIGLGQLHEHWEYEFSPATEAALVEASVYGPTIPEAVAARFAEELERLEAEGKSRSASIAVAHLVRACVVGLHDHVARLTGWLVRAVSEDSQFTSLAVATTQLALLSDSREPLEAKGLDELDRLVPTVYERACFLLRDLSATPADQQSGAVDSLKRLNEFAGQKREGIDPELFWSALANLAGNPATPPLLAGAAYGQLYGAGRLDAERMVASVTGWLDGRMDARDGVLFLRGVLQTAREAAWQRPELLRALDARLLDWDDPSFMRLLPELRLAFAEMTPQETDRIAEAAAGLHGEATLGPLIDHSLTEQQAAALAAADAEVRATLVTDGLAGWLSQDEARHA